MDKIFGQDTKTKKLFLSYLSKSNIKSVEELVDNQNYIIYFKTTTKNFLEHKLDTDDYSILLEKLWAILSGNPNTRDQKITDIALLGAELEWYLRNDPIKAGEFLNEVLNFYKMLPNTDHE